MNLLSLSLLGSGLKIIISIDLKKKTLCFFDFFLFTISLIYILIFSILFYYSLPLLVWIYFAHHFFLFILKLKVKLIT